MRLAMHAHLHLTGHMIGGKNLISFIAAVLLLFGQAVAGEKLKKMNSKYAWVLSYFKGGDNSAEANSLYLAYSIDGLHWDELNGGKPVFTVDGIGGNRIRDPFLFRKNDGRFVFIATDWTLFGTEGADPGYWSNPSPYLIIADSDDLVHFTNARRVLFAQLSDDARNERAAHKWKDMHCWAPEVFYDKAKGKYGVIWSGDGSLDGTNNINRTYVNYTDDFVTFSAPELFYELSEDGQNITEIDATLIEEGKKWYMFYKGEKNDAKDIQEACSRTLAPGSFSLMHDGGYITRTTDQSKQMFTEGPFIIKAPAGKRWYLYADLYGQDGVFGCWTTDSLENPPEKWTLLDKTSYALPSGVRHANTVQVTAEELKVLLGK